MKKEFLKMAGVKNEKDFYELFPTENHFFELYPDAKKMVKMMYGGTPKYQTEGQVPPDEEYKGSTPPLEVFNPSFAAMPFFSRNVSGNVNLGNVGKRGTNVTAGGSYDLQNKNYSVNAGTSIPTRKAGTFSVGADYSNDPMWGQSTSFNVGYDKQLKKGPNLGVNLRYSQQSQPSFRQMGGEEMPQQQQQNAGGEEQIINFVAQSLMQGEDPKKILEALVSQMGLEQEQAVQLIQAVAQKIQEQSGQQQQAQQQMMRNGGYSGTYDAGSGSYFKKGGPASPQEGEVYDMDEEQIQRLINLGYKIKYM